MHENAADFTLTFRRLCDAAADEKADANVRVLFANPAAYDSWVARWRSRLVVEKFEPNTMRSGEVRTVNPAFIPRNHRVEQALGAAIEYGDFSPFAELLTVLSRPYEDQAIFADYANPPHADEARLPDILRDLIRQCAGSRVDSSGADEDSWLRDSCRSDLPDVAGQFIHPLWLGVPSEHEPGAASDEVCRSTIRVHEAPGGTRESLTLQTHDRGKRVL